MNAPRPCHKTSGRISEPFLKEFVVNGICPEPPVGSEYAKSGSESAAANVFSAFIVDVVKRLREEAG